MDLKITKELVFKYFADEVDQQERKRIQYWISQNDENQELFFLWLEDYQIKNSENKYAIEEEFKKLESRIVKDELRAKQQYFMGKNILPKEWPKFSYGIAAVLIVFFISSLFFLFQKDSYVTYTAYAGDVRKIELPDHSEVYLNRNSSLKIRQDWNNSEDREVWLKGEAFFSVQHTVTDQKFIVHYDNLNVEVLGTKFNVKGSDGNTQVVLSSGKVKLSVDSQKKANNLVMAPGDFVEYKKDMKSFEKKRVEPELYTSWRYHKFVLIQTRLSEILPLLKENYNVEVYVKDKDLLSEKFTATLPSGNVDIILKALAKSGGFRIKKNGNRVLLKPLP